VFCFIYKVFGDIKI